MRLTLPSIIFAMVPMCCTAIAAYAQQPAEACRVPSGTYESVSESEWSVTLKLKRGGRAIVIHDSWLPGEHSGRTVEKVRATWSCRGSDVEVTYGQVSDIFRYAVDLPYHEFGFQAAGPGLSSIKPVSPDSKIGGATLWKIPMKTGDPVAEKPSNYSINPPAGGWLATDRRPRSPAAGYAGR